MLAREFSCRVTHRLWVTPTVLSLGFAPARRFPFEAGQFLSVIVPKSFAHASDRRRVRRIYSFACAPEQGFELSIKMTGGPGPSYLASLQVGDTFEASAPYGDFLYRTQPERSVCFISTGTGIAPFRAMVLSREFRESPPERAISLFGARDESEILYADELEFLGVEAVNALSKPSSSWRGFRGRVTDYLSQLPSDWNWHGTDFYLCGSGQMVDDARRILLHSRGVRPEAIFQEVYFASAPRLETAQRLELVAEQAAA